MSETVAIQDAGDTSNFDMGAAVDEVGRQLMGEDYEEDSGVEIDAEDAPAAPADKSAEKVEAPAEKAPAATTTDVPVVQAKAPPKSWAKETHEHWAKLEPSVQDYIELREKQMLDGLSQYTDAAKYGHSLRQAFQPYQQILQQRGLNEHAVINDLMTAYVRLTQGSEAERAAAFQQIGRNFGITAQHAAQQAASDDPLASSPVLTNVQQRLEKAEKMLYDKEQQDYARMQEEDRRVIQEAAMGIQRFAEEKDEKGALRYPYFDEVRELMATFASSETDMKSMYEKAVWANPVTRAKELARVQTETEAKTKERARLDALAARKAVSSNVRSRDTQKAPTEQIGTMADTMKNVLREIRSRPH